jgi:uncharacterized protein DUF202
MNEAGLSRERTRLAWRRTLLANTAVALLCVRLAIATGSGAARSLVAAAAMLVWLVALVLTYRRTRALTAPRPGPAGRAMPVSAIICLGYAVLGAILILTNPRP